MDKNHFVLFKPTGRKCWYYYVYKNGRRIWRSTGKRTKKEALTVILERVKEDNIIVQNSCSTLFKIFANDFWNYDTCPIIQEKIRRGGHYSVKVSKDRTKHLEDYIMPTFGEMFLDEITEADVRDWLLDVPELYELSNKTANDILTSLRGILDEAAKQNLVKYNVAKRVPQLIREKSERKGMFTVEEIQNLFSHKEYWRTEESRIGCLLSAYTGMRLGEVRALTLSQIFDDYIEVDASYSDAEGRKSTKSGWGRIVPITKELAMLLRNICPNKEGYVFTFSGTKPVASEFFPRGLDYALEKMGINRKQRHLSFHCFRYFMNTRLVANNIDGEKIRSVIGHENEQMTEHYLQLSDKDMDDIRKIQQESLKI